MKKKDLLKKQELTEQLGMKFDEVADFFSEETLCTMQMVKIKGEKIGIQLKSGCDANVGTCINPSCPSLNVCFDIYCPKTTTTPPTTPPRPELNWEGCPTMPPPTPPTVQQDAICWQKPPISTTK